MASDTVSEKADEAPAAAPLESTDPEPETTAEPDPPDPDPQGPVSADTTCPHCGSTFDPAGGRAVLPDERVAAMQLELSELRAQVKILAAAKRKEIVEKKTPKNKEVEKEAPPTGAGVGPAPGQGIMNWIAFGRAEKM